MKDEEMAEEYAEVHQMYVGSYCSYNALKRAFLAGLKAGRPQWHDLRENPNDLPKEGISVLVMLESGISTDKWRADNKRWFCTDYYTGEDKVIAWCEIPTFDKE